MSRGDGRQHLVTGATGFIGAALALELLASDEDLRVVCLVRAVDDGAAQARLEDALGTAAHLYGLVDVAALRLDRVRAVRGDVLESRCGVSASEVGAVEEIWHSAASLDYREARSERIFEHNLSGTAHLLELHEALGSPVLNHLSTAYVAGARTGLILEDAPLDPEFANNAYERSKIAAEQLLTQSQVAARILRPGIVIGHSSTFAATGFTGVYGFISDLRRLKEEVEKRLGNFLSHRAIRARAKPEAPLNLVPVDVVTRTAVALSAAAAPSAVYHLTNATAPTVGDVVRVVCEEVGVRPFELGASPDDFTAIDERFDEDPRTEFFRSYITAQRTFDQANVRAALGAPAGADLPAERWRNYVRWYLDHLREREAEAGEKFGLFRAREAPSAQA